MIARTQKPDDYGDCTTLNRLFMIDLNNFNRLAICAVMNGVIEPDVLLLNNAQNLLEKPMEPIGQAAMNLRFL